MRTLWKPLYEKLVGDEELVGLLLHTIKKPKIVKGGEELFPDLPYVTMNLDTEEPLVLQAPTLSVIGVRISILTGANKVCETIAEKIRILLDHGTFTSEAAIVYSCYWMTCLLPLLWEDGMKRWRIDDEYRFVARSL